MTPEAATAVSPPLAEISRAELMRRLDDPSLTIVDVLAPASYETHHIPGAINLPVAKIDTQAGAVLPDRAAEVAVYCAQFT